MGRKPANRAPGASAYNILDYRKCTASQVGWIFGVRPQAVSAWKDCPRNKDGTWHLASVVQWKMKRAQEEAELDAGIDERGDGLERYRAARADRAELEVAQMRGELVSKSDVEARWGRVLSHLVQAFDGLGKVLAPRLAMRHEKEIAQTVRDEVRHTIESARAMMLADEEL